VTSNNNSNTFAFYVHHVSTSSMSSQAYQSCRAYLLVTASSCRAGRTCIQKCRSGPRLILRAVGVRGSRSAGLFCYEPLSGSNSVSAHCQGLKSSHLRSLLSSVCTFYHRTLQSHHMFFLLRSLNTYLKGFNHSLPNSRLSVRRCRGTVLKCWIFV